MSLRGRAFDWWAPIALALTAATVLPARASDPGPTSRPNRTVERLAAQAKKALELGEHARAADLYLAAFKQDPTQVVLTFNAARAMHLGRRLDRAEVLYLSVVKFPNVDEKLAQSARGYLEEIWLSRADDRALEAQILGQQRRFGEAAAAWRDAYRIAQQRIFYLLRAARAQRLSDKPLAAIADYEQFLARSQDNSERAEALRELNMLRPPGGEVAAPQATSPTDGSTAPATAAPTSAEPAAGPLGDDPDIAPDVGPRSASAAAPPALPNEPTATAAGAFAPHVTYLVGMAAESTSKDRSDWRGGPAVLVRGRLGWQMLPRLGGYVSVAAGQQVGFPAGNALQVGAGVRRPFAAGDLTGGLEWVVTKPTIGYPCAWTADQRAQGFCQAEAAVRRNSTARARIEWSWFWPSGASVAVALLAEVGRTHSDALYDNGWGVGAALGVGAGRP